MENVTKLTRVNFLKTNYESLPDNYSLEKSRLAGVQKQLRESYDTIIKIYLDENIVEEVKDKEFLKMFTIYRIGQLLETKGTQPKYV